MVPLAMLFPREDAIYCLVCVISGHKCPGKTSTVEKFYCEPAIVSACKVHFGGKKKPDSNEPCISYHCKT